MNEPIFGPRPVVPLSAAARQLRVRFKPLAVASVIAVVAFFASFALVVVLTSWYRASIDDVVAVTDVTFLCGVAFVLATSLGGFIAGISSRTTDPAVGGLHAALSTIGVLALSALGAAISSLVREGSVAFLSQPSGLAIFLYVVAGMSASIVAGRAGAQRNRDDVDNSA